jgi:hypothetical protein
MPLSRTLAAAEWTFDRLEEAWEGARVQRWVGTAIVASFLVGLTVIEANRLGWLPAPIAERLPTSHFHAVALAFVLVLLAEIVGMVFSLGRSVANSVGKQFEVLSLILLRQSFKELTGFAEPVAWKDATAAIGPMLAFAAGALLVFLGLAVYYRLQRHQPITADVAERSSFVAAKKLIALLLFACIVLLGIDAAARLGEATSGFPFFDSLYTLLIFSDILIVLISLRTASRYEIVFRNSGFAASTVFVRISLTAPPYLSVGLGVFAIVFACGVTLAYNFFLLPRKAAGERVILGEPPDPQR